MLVQEVELWGVQTAMAATGVLARATAAAPTPSLASTRREDMTSSLRTIGVRRRGGVSAARERRLARDAPLPTWSSRGIHRLYRHSGGTGQGISTQRVPV